MNLNAGQEKYSSHTGKDAQENEEDTANWDDPMQQCTLEIRDEDRHAMTAVGSDVLRCWIGCPGIGA